MFLKKYNFKNPLLLNFISLTLLQSANYIFPLLTIPYLFRVLGVETFGLVSFATAFIQYFVILTDFGFNLYGVQFISLNRDNKEARDHFFLNVLVIQLLLFVVGLIILTIIISSIDKFRDNKLLFLFSYTSVLGTVLLPTWFFQGLEQMKYIARITIIVRSLAILPIFIFVKSDNDYLLIPLFYGFGAIITGAIALYVAISRFDIKIDFLKFSMLELMSCLKESSAFFISRISVSLYTVSNTFVLGIVGGNMIVGYYAAAEKLYMAIQSLYGPLNNAIYPFMVKNKNLNVYKKIFGTLVIINCIALPLCIYNSDFIMGLIYKQVAPESSNVLKILLAGCIISIPSILLGYPLLGAFGHARFTNFTVIVGSIFHITMLGLLIFINSITIYSVAMLVIVTELLVLSLRINGVRRLIFKTET